MMQTEKTEIVAEIEIQNTALAEPLAAANDFRRASVSEATKRHYRADWSVYVGFCIEHGVEPLEAGPDAIAAFCAARAQTGDKVSTITRRLAAIAKAFRTSRLPSPTTHDAVRETMAGIRRELGVARRQKSALVTDAMHAVLSVTEENLRGARDRAVLSLGFVGALRRSEIAALDLGDVSFHAEGATVIVRRSKTDQEGAGSERDITATGSTTCPVAALRAWIAAAGIVEGPLFRELDNTGTRLRPGRMSDRAVARAVQRLARAAGLEGDFGGHSLRAGFATSGTLGGVPRAALKRQGNWKSDSIMDGYYRRSQRFQVDYSKALGL